MNNNKQNGITLVALVITIIVMLILTSVTLSILIDSNIIGTAKGLNDKKDIALIIEETVLAIQDMDICEDAEILTVSEKVENLKEQGILNADRTFTRNNKYHLEYNGDVEGENGEVYGNVRLYSEAQTCKDVISVSGFEGVTERSKVVVDGSFRAD